MQLERGKYGADLRARRRSVYDRVLKKGIATFHYFEYGTPAERAGNFAWKYNCGPASINPLSDDVFIKRILRDETATSQGSARK
jgi:hypothetical protein